MSTHAGIAAAPQAYTEISRREGGVPRTDTRSRSKPSRPPVSLTPERDAAEQKRRQKGPEYPIQRISTTYMLAQVTTLLTRSTITASYDGLVGLASSELVVLASPRLIRCLYCYKGFRCLTKRKKRCKFGLKLPRATMTLSDGPWRLKMTIRA